MKIANIELAGNLILAPIAGYSDIGMRMLSLRYGAGLAFCEMVSAKGLYYNSEKTKTLLATHPAEKIKAAQLFGSEPEIMAEAVAGALADFDIIDINLGCPVRKIVSNGEGCALMRNPDKVFKIVSACKAAAPGRAISAKIRAGLDKESINAVEIALAVEAAGASFVTVHGRTRDMFYSGKADPEVIAKVKRALTIPVIGNGDVTDRQSYQRMLEYTGADGVMIARGALGKPYIFSEILGLPYDYNLYDLIMEHFSELNKILPERAAVSNMKKHIAFYVKGHRRQKLIKEKVFQAAGAEQLTDALEYLKEP
ncbi:MAG: tRNA dihydrouridine synthase DusB [Christensenellales bacterium]|jgi:tRNA-dihydrouridine synthase B